MGVTLGRALLVSCLIASLAGAAFAEPKLRLSTAAVGPISIAAGSNGARQLVEAYNAGDGTLAPAVTASETWLAPAVGSATGCTTRSGLCFPINIDLQTASLSKGVQTGIVTVTAPNAIDAPQTITVTVQIGGGVPDKVDLYVAPNGSSDAVHFQTNSELKSTVTASNGGSWLSLAIDGFGTFRFVWPYLIRAQHISGMAAGNYTGSVKITSSTFQPDIKNVPVTLKVTSDPIATLTPDHLRIRVAEKTSSRKPRSWFRIAGLAR